MKLSFEENRLDVEIAFRYYFEQKTQGEIAEEMGLSRVKVQRTLQRCLDSGIVRITIEDPLVKCVELEKQLMKRFDLKEAHVVMTPSNGAFVHQQVALKGANVFDSKLCDGITVGAAWGRMVNEIVDALRPSSAPKVQFVSVVGGLTTELAVNPFSIIHKLGGLYGGPVYYISAPAVVDDLEVKDAILGERSLQKVFQKMDDIDLTFVGIGSVGEHSTLSETGYLSSKELAEFRAKGAVGEVLLYHYDIDGNIIESDYHQRLVGIGSDRLKKIETVMGVAAGPEKVESIIGAIRGEFINILVTDEATAESILAYRIAE